MEAHDATFPLTLDDGELWVRKFEEFSAELSGLWSVTANEAYRHCFDVDLVKLGNMYAHSSFSHTCTIRKHTRTHTQ
jgi:hypothetical protein